MFCLCGGWPDEVCEGRDFGAWNAEAVANEVVERQFQFHAGFGQSQHDVASVAAFFTDGSAGAFFFVTKVRMSFSEALVLSGISGRSSTRRSSSLLRCCRLSSLSRVAKPVLTRLKIRSKRSWACSALGGELVVFQGAIEPPGFAGDEHGIGGDFQPTQAKGLQMTLPVARG